MTALWTMFLEIFQVGLFWLTQFYGGSLASAIITFSLLARVALLPLTVRMALRARAKARLLKVIRPELERVQARWKEEPRRRVTETMAVYERHGVRPVDPGMLKGSLVQMPILVGLFAATRNAIASRLGEQGFLWVANLARPDFGVALVVFSVVALGAAAGASESQPSWTFALAASASAAMAMFVSAGFGLYLAASGLVGALQGLIVRRIEGRA